VVVPPGPWSQAVYLNEFNLMSGPCVFVFQNLPFSNVEFPGGATSVPKYLIRYSSVLYLWAQQNSVHCNT
jgi:hypothetical protein